MGVVYDNIQADHTLKFGSPVPEDNYCSRNRPAFKNMMDTFDLKDFPAGNLPSGGASCRISPSEMILIELELRNYSPRDDTTHFRFYKVLDRNVKELYHSQGPDFAEDPSWTWYWSYDYAFIGHFDWEINEPGKYYVLVSTVHGEAKIEFNVIDTGSPPPKCTDQGRKCQDSKTVCVYNVQDCKFDCTPCSQGKECKDGHCVETPPDCLGEGEFNFPYLGKECCPGLHSDISTDYRCVKDLDQPPPDASPCPKGVSTPFTGTSFIGNPECPKGYNPDIIAPGNPFTFTPPYGACLCIGATPEEIAQAKKAGREQYEKDKGNAPFSGLGTLIESLPMLIYGAIILSILSLFKR